MTGCLCSHPKSDHAAGECSHKACGCGSFRPRTVAAEVESFLAARFPDKPATTEGEVA